MLVSVSRLSTASPAEVYWPFGFFFRFLAASAAAARRFSTPVVRPGTASGAGCALVTGPNLLGPSGIRGAMVSFQGNIAKNASSTTARRLKPKSGQQPRKPTGHFPTSFP